MRFFRRHQDADLDLARVDQLHVDLFVCKYAKDAFSNVRMAPQADARNGEFSDGGVAGDFAIARFLERCLEGRWSLHPHLSWGP